MGLNAGKGLIHASKRRLISGLLMAAVVVAVVMGAGAWVEHRGLAALSEAARQRVEVQALSLSNAVARFESLPYTVALNVDLALLAQHSHDKALQARVNGYLERVNQKAGSTVLYLMDRNGLTLASSNWSAPTSYVGENYAFRPYFSAAVSGGFGRFYGVGVTTGLAGYYMASPVYSGQQVMGVVAVKISLDALESSWAHSLDQVVVFDSRGVAFLSGEPSWRLRTREPLSDSQRADVRSARQYGNGELAPLTWQMLRTLGPGVRLMRVAGDDGERTVLAMDRHLPAQDWTLTLLVDYSGVADAASQARVAAGLLCAVLLLGLWVLSLRRRRGAEQLAARRALEDARVGLERMVTERTADLVQANRTLQLEVSERGRAERELRSAQQELVQAAKLAVVGQMAAGVTHELNQPLAALDALAAASSAYLAQSRVSDAVDNLARMRDLVARMGRITSQLRNFSRRSEGLVERVLLSDALSNACFLVDQLLCKHGVSLDRSGVPVNLVVAFDANRLEQVLVNLMRNAIDATRGRAGPMIVVSAVQDGQRVRLSVRDNGTGIAPEAWSHLFDPFFTTKPAGEGLGLGLAISQSIARDCGAHLEAVMLPAGDGALMQLDMALWADTQPPAASDGHIC
jgi:two-component system C4-dicarboxylate transport sensor histidine kinase DctB